MIPAYGDGTVSLMRISDSADSRLAGIVNNLNSVRATLAGQIMLIDGLIQSLSATHEPQAVPSKCKHLKAYDVSEMGSPGLLQCDDCGQTVTAPPVFGGTR